MNAAAARLDPALLDKASEPYRASGRFAYGFARGKLRRDPVFGAILARGLLTQRARILDLGCGQGLLAAWLLAAGSRARIRGIELEHRYVVRAQRAWGKYAAFETGDLRKTDFGSVDGIVILDVLHYIEYADQCNVLLRARRALLVDGVLLLRVADGGGGWGFKLAKWVDQTTLVLRGRGFRQLHYRSALQWQRLLSDSGFDSEAVPMSRGTPFANVLMIATPRSVVAPE
ncbi:MAG: class I SAM-dependent methyltransferase [Pseudomonadota bacterium]|nr:class I SAM-dependent methyltransferase [Pseudomonadota bacterium]